MSQRHKDIITRHFKELVENLNAASILPTLVQEAIITFDEMEKIETQSTKQHQAKELVKLVHKKEDRAFYVLIASCREKTMPHIANLLEEAGIIFPCVTVYYFFVGREMYFGITVHLIVCIFCFIIL